MESHSLLTSILSYLAVAVITVPLFRRFGLGAILGYLVAGILIGPQGLGFVQDPEEALHFSEIGVVMLLFLIGLELHPDKLWRMRMDIALIGGGQLLLTAAILALVSMFAFGYGFQLALLIALTLALSSTAFAVQLMAEQGILASSLGRKGFSVLLLQDMAVIPILLLIQSWAVVDDATHSYSWTSSLLIVVMILLVGRFALNPLLKVVADYGSREVMTAAGLLIVLGTAYAAEMAGFSMGMGAFMAGVLLANSSFRHQLETDIDPFKGLLLGLFFIAVGMTMDLRLLISEPLLILGGALLLMAIKTSVILGVLKLRSVHWRDGLTMGLMLSQGGEFAFVIMTEALQYGLVDTAISNRIVMIVGLSMALTVPAVIFWKSRCDQRGEADPQYETSWDRGEPEVIIAGFGRFGQIVGRMLAASDIPFTALEKSAEHVEFVKHFGNRIFYGDATRLDLLQSAGIEEAQLLVVAMNSKASVALVEQVREQYPDMPIVARAVDRAHAYQLHALGVKYVIREYFSSSLDAARETLTYLGLTEQQAAERAEIFRQHDEENLKRAVEHRDNQEKLFAIARDGRAELENLFSNDKVIRKKRDRH